jgi:sulfonate transport system permease protein
MNIRHYARKFHFLLSWLVPALLIVLWQIFCSIGWISDRTLPAPLTVIEAAVRLTRSGPFWDWGSAAGSGCCWDF